MARVCCHEVLGIPRNVYSLLYLLLMVVHGSSGCANVSVFHLQFGSFLVNLEILDGFDITGYRWPSLRLYLAMDTAWCLCQSIGILLFWAHYLALVVLLLLLFHDHHREVLHLLVLMIAILLRDLVNPILVHKVGRVVR